MNGRAAADGGVKIAGAGVHEGYATAPLEHAITTAARHYEDHRERMQVSQA
jgi:hypothetical protein